MEYLNIQKLVIHSAKFREIGQNDILLNLCTLAGLIVQCLHGRLLKAGGVCGMLARPLRAVLAEGARRQEALPAVQGDRQAQGPPQDLPLM